MNNTVRTIMVWLVIGIVLTMVFMQVGNRQTSANVARLLDLHGGGRGRAASPR